MFTVDTAINDRMLREKDLFKVLFSMNQHQVATPDLSVEDARSYIFFVRDGGKACVYVGLYFIRTGAHQYYTHSSNPFPEADLADIENQARSFAEDLGALLDELDFGKLSPAEKKQWFDEQEVITRGKTESSPPESVSDLVEQTPAISSTQTEKPSASVPPAAEQPAEQQVQQMAAIPQPAPAAVSPQAAAPVQTASPAQPASAIPTAPIPVPMQAIPPVWPEPVQAPVQTVPPLVQPMPLQAPPETTSVQPETAIPPVFPPAVLQESEAKPLSQQQMPPHAAPHTVSQQSVAPHPNAVAKKSLPPDAETGGDQPRPEDVLAEAVKAGVVKAPKAQLQKDIRTTAGAVRREKEALARLLASF